MPVQPKDDGFPLDALRFHRRELCEAVAESDDFPTDAMLQRIAAAHMAVLAMEAVLDENRVRPDLRRELLTPEDRQRKAKAEADQRERDIYTSIANNKLP